MPEPSIVVAAARAAAASGSSSVGQCDRFEVQVRPVEPGDDDLRVAQPQPVGDVVAYRRGRGRGQRHDRRPAERLDHVAERQVVGAEVVAPRGDAVRLVDRDQRRASAPRTSASRSGLRELLRRDEQEPARPARSSAAPRPAVSGVSAELIRTARSSRHVAGVERRDLVLLQGEQRRDDQGRAGQQRRRHLVDRGLAGAGGQHDQRVRRRRTARIGVELAGAQRAPAEVRACGAAQPQLGEEVHRPPSCPTDATVNLRPTDLVLPHAPPTPVHSRPRPPRVTAQAARSRSSSTGGVLVGVRGERGDLGRVQRRRTRAARSPRARR